MKLTTAILSSGTKPMAVFIILKLSAMPQNCSHCLFHLIKIVLVLSDCHAVIILHGIYSFFVSLFFPERSVLVPLRPSINVRNLVPRRF